MTDEEKLRQQQEILKAQQRELLKKLKAIGTDFWGGGAADGAADDGAAERRTAPPMTGRRRPLTGPGTAAGKGRTHQSNRRNRPRRAGRPASRILRAGPRSGSAIYG